MSKTRWYHIAGGWLAIIVVLDIAATLLLWFAGTIVNPMFEKPGPSLAGMFWYQIQCLSNSRLI